MTQFTLMNAATTPGGALTPTAVPGAPTRASFTFSITAPPTGFGYGQATILATSDGIDFLPILVMKIEPFGPKTFTETLRFGADYTQFDALLDNIVPGGISGTVTMNV